MNHKTRRITILASVAIAVFASGAVAAQPATNNGSAKDAPITVEVTNGHGPAKLVTITEDTPAVAFSVNVMHDGKVVQHQVIRTLGAVPAAVEVLSKHRYVDAVYTTGGERSGAAPQKHYAWFTTGVSMSIAEEGKADSYRVKLHLSDLESLATSESGLQLPKLHEVDKDSIERLTLHTPVQLIARDSHDSVTIERIL